MESFEEDRVIGRVEELNQIRSFISTRLTSKKGGSLYVCGRPGTGKTEAIRQIYDGLKSYLEVQKSSPKGSAQKKKKAKTMPEYNLAWVNGNSAGSFLVTIAHEFGVKDQSALEKTLSSPNGGQMYLLVTDEIDSVTPEVVRRLFGWATEKSSLILVGIANVVNASVSIFKGQIHQPEELPFRPYDAKQLLEIVKKKLGDRAERFKPEVLEMISKRISSRSGDVRACMNLCEKTLQAVKTMEKITLIDMRRATSAQSSLSKTIEGLPAQCKFALVACTLASQKKAKVEDDEFSGMIPSTGDAAASDENVKYTDMVEVPRIRSCWLQLKEIWKIPTEGDVMDHLKTLSESRVLDMIKKKGKRANDEFKILPTRDEIYNGLVGGGGTEGDGDENKNPDLIKKRPIIMAFNGIKLRNYANMHAPLEKN